MTYYNLPPTRFANEYNDFEKSLRALPVACPGEGMAHLLWSIFLLTFGKLYPYGGKKVKFMNI